MKQIRHRIVEEARSYINVPFVHAGRNRMGIDCVGLLIMVGHALDLFDWDDVDYGTMVDHVRLRHDIDMFCHVTTTEQMIGDIVLFNILGFPTHVGIITQTEPEPLFVHAYYTAGKVIEERLDNPWVDRIEERFFWKSA